MSLLLRNAYLTLCLLILFGCATHGLPRWRNFQGDLRGQGYLPLESGFAVSSAWISSPYNITTSSPVIGVDRDGREVIYFGTVDGELVALKSENGKERWRRSFASDSKTTAIISTPAISRNGNIYIVTNQRNADRRISSSLHKVDEFSRIRWSYTISEDGFTSGAPKILVWGQDTLIFVYVTLFVDGDPQGELLVLHDRGKAVELLDRESLGTCQWGSTELQTRTEDVADAHAGLWEFTSVFTSETADGGVSVPDQFIDPSVAVFTDRKLPLIAIADNLCNVGAFEWDDELTPVWREFHPYERHSSTALLPNGLMVFGRQDGTVLARDMETGIQIWSHNAGQPVFATPAATDSYLFVIAKDLINVLDQKDGNLVYDAGLPRQFRLPRQTYASPAVTQNRVYVATTAMMTFSYDLSTRSQDTNFHGNGLASIALGNNGAIYAVAVDGRIHKYPGPK
jgi:outer membrane protein assembly factor BamB